MLLKTEMGIIDELSFKITKCEYLMKGQILKSFIIKEKIIMCRKFAKYDKQ